MSEIERQVDAIMNEARRWPTKHGERRVWLVGSSANREAAIEHSLGYVADFDTKTAVAGLPPGGEIWRLTGDEDGVRMFLVSWFELTATMSEEA